MLPPSIAWALTIDGSAKLLKAGSLNIRRVANGRSTASFQLDSENQTYRPPLDGVVSMSANGTVVMAGLIDRPSEGGIFAGVGRGIRTTVNVVDFWAYTEWRHIRASFPEQSLAARLAAIITAAGLADYGITLHGSQVTGPTLPAVDYDDARCDAVLQETMTLTADAGQPFTVGISFTKVLRAQQPSAMLAPFNLIGDDLSAYVIGDIEVEPSNDGQANKVIVKVAPQSQVERVESFTGDGVADSVTLTYTVTRHYGYVTYDGIYETLRTPDDPDAASWTYDPADNTLTRTAGALGSGVALSIHFDGTFSGRWEATDASWASTPTTRRQKVITLESIPDGATGQAFAEAELAKSLTGPIYVRYTTLREGIEPGQQQTINVPSRNVNAAGVITEVVIRDRGQWLERSVTVIVDDAQTNLNRTWGDVYKAWLGDKTGGGVQPTGGAAVATGGPGAPNMSVQFNRSGAFGGDADFTYNADTNSLVCGGGGSSISAASHESCFVFGHNCHITD